MIAITLAEANFLRELKATLHRHNCPLDTLDQVLCWLDQRLTDYEAMRDEPLQQYSASRPETRSEGEFSGRLREQQAKSAQAAMMGMGMKLQEANDEIDRLRGKLAELERFAEDLTTTAAPLMSAFPDPSAFGIYLRVHSEEIRRWCQKARLNPELAEEMVANEKVVEDAKEKRTR